MRPLLTLFLATLVLLQSCGGGSSSAEPPLSEHDQLQQAAEAMRLQALALASPEPCTRSDQCASLVLRSELPPCYFTETIDYSLAAPGAAAASAAVAEFNALSLKARALEAPSTASGSCFVNVEARPLNCVANKCVRALVF